MWHIEKYIAEFVSILIYVPCGVIFGYLVFYPLFYVQDETTGFYKDLEFWPFIIIIITSIIVSGEITITKLFKYKYNITHIYYIFLSCILFLSSGICIILNTGNEIAAIYIGAVAFGLAYIPAMSYLNIRSSDNGRWRILKLSSSHLFFFIGIASVYTIISDKAEQVHENIGLLLIIPNGLFILLCMINELIHYKDFGNYKISKDEEIYINNKNHTLFNDKLPKDIKSNTTWTSQLSNINIIDDNNNVSSIKQILITIALLIYKCRDSIIFNHILLYTLNSFDLITSNLYWRIWIFVAGVLLGCILLLFIGTNTLVLLSSVISMGSLIALITLINLENDVYFNSNVYINDDIFDIGREVLLLVFFFGIAMSQCVANINLLQMTKFKYTEIILTCGFTIEITIIFILQYLFINNTEFSLLSSFVTNSYVVLVVLFLFGFLLILIPNTKNYSLIYIRNILLGVKYNTKFYGPGAYLQQPMPTTVQSYGMSMAPNQYQEQFNFNNNNNNNNQMSDYNSLNSLNMTRQPQYMPEYAQPIKKNKLQKERPLTPTAPLQQYQLQQVEAYDYQSLPRSILLPRAYIAPVKMAVELEKKY